MGIDVLMIESLRQTAELPLITLQAGVVITVEPGIYIPAGSKCDKKWWNIGIRIEDDILITEKGPENISAGSPRTVADIEKMAKQKGIF